MAKKPPVHVNLNVSPEVRDHADRLAKVIAKEKGLQSIHRHEAVRIAILEALENRAKGGPKA